MLVRPSGLEVGAKKQKRSIDRQRNKRNALDSTLTGPLPAIKTQLPTGSVHSYSRMSKSTLSRELLRIGKAWPPDILRPRLQYGNYLVAFAESKELQKKLSPKTVRSQQRLLDNTLKEKVSLSLCKVIFASN